MKKQILFFMIFSLALLFAGITKTYGQYTNYLEGPPVCTPAIPLNCATGSGLNPLPGEVYTYTITTAPEAIGNVLWFVTDESEVITWTDPGPAVLQPNRDVINGDYVLTATAGVYDDPTNTSKTIDISWKAFDGTAHEVLLVAYVTGAAGCSDNVEVFRIEPTFAFTLDVIALLDDGTNGDTECLSPVESAEYDGTNLNMDYGENWVFFSVNAANFDHSWEPTFTAAAANGSTTPTVEWAYPADAEGNVAGTWHASGVPVLAQSATGSVGEIGECIVIRVRVDHAGVQHAVNEVVTLTINGIMYDVDATTGNEYNNPDLADMSEPSGGTGECVNNLDDTGTYTLTARPILTATSPAGGFEPKLP